jgi:cell division protein FtsB
LKLPTKAAIYILSAVFLGLSSWLGYNAIWGQEGLHQKQRLDREIEMLRLELEKLRKENRELRSTIRKLHQDHEARQDEVRRELGMLRKDEAILLPGNTDSSSQ